VVDPDNGEAIYLGDGTQYAALGATDYDGCAGLLLPGGAPMVIEAGADKHDRTEVVYEIDLAETGDATIRRVETIRGTDYEARHRRYAEMTPENRRRHFLEMVAELSQSAKAVGELTTDFDAYPGTVAFTAEVPDFAVRDGDYLYLQTPGSLGGLFWLRSAERENPLYLSRPRQVDLTIRVRLPEGFVAAMLPAGLNWDRPLETATEGGPSPCRVTVRTTAGAGSGGAAEADIEAGANGEAGRELVLRASAKVDPAVVSPEGYADLFELNRLLGRKAARLLLLQRQPVAAR
jgi:hypothetical protein